MRDEILSYAEMVMREKQALQAGMNYRDPPRVSIFLMSRRPNAPYEDSLSEDGTELVYEGHDMNRSRGVDPKSQNQPRFTRTGRLTQNGKFAEAVDRSATFTVVRVYEKLREGIWSDKGLFDITHYEYVSSGGRKVFKFHLRLSPNQEDETSSMAMAADRPMSRIIPGWIKQEVFKRDNGQCVICGAKDQLHFDHDLPYSRGGTSFTVENVRVLCARHNLSKGAKIE